jgi:GDP-L-fucose synthase
MSILVTGGSGQVGKELQQLLPQATYISSKDCNLIDDVQVRRLLSSHNFDTIIHLAAKVGGILDNINNPTEYYSDNILMNTLLVDYARKFNVTKFIGILSTCIYPDKVDSYPLKEDTLHLGPPTKTNFSYGVAKRGMAVHIDATNEQYGTKYCYITPCNLYGVYDKFDDRSHFVAALIKKIYDANKAKTDKITLFGTGTPLRQFMNAKDFAAIIKQMIDRNITESFNVASPDNISIDSIARIALDACNCNHITIEYDGSKPDGQYRKDVCTEKLKNIFPDFQFTDLKEGINTVYESLCNNPN